MTDDQIACVVEFFAKTSRVWADNEPRSVLLAGVAVGIIFREQLPEASAVLPFLFHMIGGEGGSGINEKSLRSLVQYAVTKAGLEADA